jgi:hypothetical protein
MLVACARVCHSDTLSIGFVLAGALRVPLMSSKWDTTRAITYVKIFLDSCYTLLYVDSIQQAHPKPTIGDTMTRKHFVAIAKVIASLPLTPEDNQIVAERFASELAQFNPMFDRARFIAAATEAR